MALLATAALVLASAVVAAPASAADSKAIVAVGQPLGVATRPDGTLYVARSKGAQSEIGVVAPGAGEVSLVMKVSAGTHWLTVGPEGSLYMVNPNEDSMSVVVVNRGGNSLTVLDGGPGGAVAAVAAVAGVGLLASAAFLVVVLRRRRKISGADGAEVWALD